MAASDFEFTLADAPWLFDMASRVANDMPSEDQLEEALLAAARARCIPCDDARRREGRAERIGQACDICDGRGLDYLGRPCRHCTASQSATSNANTTDQPRALRPGHLSDLEVRE